MMEGLCTKIEFSKKKCPTTAIRKSNKTKTTAKKKKNRSKPTTSLKTAQFTTSKCSVKTRKELKSKHKEKTHYPIIKPRGNFHDIHCCPSTK
jgi:hypothetical protein